jgi:Fungal chitosanase of glycosyl hydrolase group 75
VRKLGLGTLRRIVLLIFFALFVAITLRWISLERWRWTLTRAEEIEAPSPTPTAAPSASATRPPTLSGKFDISRLFNGITLRSEVETTSGTAASEERVDPMSYAIDLKLRVRVPTPNRTVDELGKVSPDLGKLLPGLATMVKPEAVSPLFAQLYETKVRELRENLSRLDLLLSRHNFYDCQTVLALRHPESKRRALLFQADMDVDADGSDGDRAPAGNGVSPTFKPFTSFRWGKKSNRPNPYLSGIEDRLHRVDSEQKTATPERKRDLKNAVTELRDEIAAMKKYSYLIGTYDPFIVVPASFTKGSDAAHVGDYAVVIAGSTIYPAIVGDVGPNDRVGEASLRIAKEVNALSNPNNRPISELKATYIVFNGTADSSWGPPDLEKLQARCEALVKEIGGATAGLHHWVNTVPPLPTPTPTPTPTPSPTPSISPTPSASPTPTPMFSETPSPTSPPLIHPTFAFPTPTPSPTATF